MLIFQDFTKSELTGLLVPLSPSKAKYRARQIFHWVYQRNVTDWNAMTDLSKDLRQWLCENMRIACLREISRKDSEDGTCKFLWSLGESQSIESVIIPMDSEEGTPRITACISSQVGCAMGCGFCLTGIQGLTRHLEVHEIVAQVCELRSRAPVTNIVFMGMGEPLHNVSNVIKACGILLDGDGLNFSKRKVTVSTSGIVPAIAKLMASTDVSLAISLNATTDEQRSRIMPINKKWKIADVLGACRKIHMAPHRKITFEYVLIRGLNDSVSDAERMVGLLRGIPAKINLIPMNEHPGSPWLRPDDRTIKAFQHVLVSQHLTATIRSSRGRDILAACGQLSSGALLKHELFVGDVREHRDADH